MAAIPFARTELHVDVGRIAVAADERLDLTVDVAARLRPGQSVLAPAAKMIELATGGSVTQSTVGTVSVAGTVITIPVYGFVKGKQYQLIVTFSPASGVTQAALWDLDCVA